MQRASHRPIWAIRFGERVRERRQARERPLSQQALGELAGLHRTFVGHVEQGATNVTLRTIVRLADALGVDPAELVRGLTPDPADARS
jgi:transcriptional regulator with XRE-family HTH domain